MVPPIQVVYDIAGTVAYFGLVPLLWIVLFLLAWEDGAFARSIGFGPRTFWLLVLGVVLAFFAELPFAQFDGDFIAINIGGGLIPLALSCALFARFAPPRSRSLPAFLVLFGIECAAAFALVVTLSDPAQQDVGLTVIAALATGAALALPARWGYDRAVGALVGLTSGVLVVTFLITSSVPGVGITAPFPADLVAPVAAGVIAALLAPFLFGDSKGGFAIPVAFISGTFGVIIGADLLRQPPLYGSGPTGLYVIGGANLLDLVYLSGLLAFGAAYLTYRSGGLPREPAPSVEADELPAPTRLLTDAIRLRFDGDPTRSVRQASAAARSAAAQSRRLLDRPTDPKGRPWEGLPVPGWVVADQANLDRLAETGTTEPLEADRAAQMARLLVGLGRFLNSPRFATAAQRFLAFLLDLTIVSVPSAVVGLLILNGIPSGSDVLASLALLTASYAYIALAYLYWVVFDVAAGTTPGKWVVGIQVRDRTMAVPGLVPSMVRESTKLVALTALGVFGPVVLAAAQGRTLTVAGVPLSGVVDAVALAALIALVFAVTSTAAAVSILTSSDRQRMGDRIAGTLVVKRAVPAAPKPWGMPAPKDPTSGASGS